VPTLTAAHRRDLAELTGLAQNDLTLIWAKFNTATAARDGLIELLPRLVAIYGSAAATLGADWYDEMRAAAKVKGRFRAIPAELPDQGRTDALARWGVTPLFAAEPNYDMALGMVEGGLQRIISNADRETVTDSAIADPQAVGWQRTGGGECAFCQMLIDRGAVYSEASASFDSHDHCKCSAEPNFDAARLTVRWGSGGKKRRLFQEGDRLDPRQTTGIRSEADRKRLREYLANH